MVDKGIEFHNKSMKTWLEKNDIKIYSAHNEVKSVADCRNIGTFYETEFQKTNQKEFRVEKVIKRNREKLYVKWKGYDSSFNSWIDKKDYNK